ncbi:hypothetical protein ACJJTC_009039 [Scirpophaga incertulas]
MERRKINFQNVKPLDMEGIESTPRRSTRTRATPKKYGTFLKVPKSRHNIDYEQDSTSDEDIFEEGTSHIPNTDLLSDCYIDGMHKFDKVKSSNPQLDLKKSGNTPKATVSPVKTPKKLHQELFTSSKTTVSAVTPRHVKDKIKKRIIREVDSDSNGGDFSGSSSEFLPSDDDKSDSSSSEQMSEDSDSEDEHPKKSKKLQIVKRGDTQSKSKDTEYYVTSDDYFLMHSGKKNTTSDHTLARLKKLNISGGVGEDLYISKEHKTKITKLMNSYEQLFDKWLYILSQNCNLILYGVGSKRALLHMFQEKNLSDFPCIVVNGFFPSLTLKSVVDTIVIDLLKNSQTPSNIGDVVNLIDSQLTDLDMNLFLIVHNIDGAMLRNAKCQTILSNIAQINNVHIIATIDHINAPLLWDNSKLCKFKFIWWDVTTFMPYAEETSFENSIMTQRTGVLQIASMRSVYDSLTSNAKGIFTVIINYQLENQNVSHYQGLPFKDLYSKCREQFLVSSDLALRTQLTEFLDHKLVKMKRSYDGSENLVIPIDNSLLQGFLDQLES